MTLQILIFHAVAFSVSAFSLFYDLSLQDVPRSQRTFGGKWKYLTVWNIWLQTMYFSYSLLVDVTCEEVGPEHRRRTFMSMFRDWFHTWVAFPVGMFVVMSFWTLYAIDRELVFPKALDEIFPSWLNHTLHTTVFPFLLVEKIMIYHHHSKKHVGLPVSCGLGLIYIGWILYLAFKHNIWVYPVLEVLAPGEKVIFIGMCVMFHASIYILGESLTTYIWRKEISKTGVKQSSKKKN